MPKYRVERDSLGKVRVPQGALYGAQTQRAVENFPLSGVRMPGSFIHALGLIKQAAASVNRRLGLLDPTLARGIEWASHQVEQGKYDDQFPVDIFQTGSATSTHMNANEVIARLASRRLGRRVHPNDHVNLSQSTNDVIPSAIHLSATQAVTRQLIPALRHLKRAIDKRARELEGIVKTGRTHLMDAMPITMSQEFSGWSSQVGHGIQRIESVLPRLKGLAFGATAVGTGVNAHPMFGVKMAAEISRRTGIRFAVSRNPFESLSCQDTAVELSGQLKAVAVSLFKIANDLRWMASGPLAGLGEIRLPSLQPGSSIMPGKVNPVVPEAAAMVCVQVIGNDATIALAGASGNFQLNVMLSLIAYRILQSIELLANASRLLADKAIRGLKANEDRIAQTLQMNPILVTALNPLIGYERGAKIAQAAYTQGRRIIDVAAEMTAIPRKKLQRILDPRRLTQGGLLSGIR